jgi:hypothetical protein
VARFPNPVLADQWRKRFERFDRSDLTVAQFCQREDYCVASFYQWRRKLRQPIDSTAGGFVAVEIDSNRFGKTPDSSIEIELPGGAVMRFPAEAPDALQRKLISAINSATTDEAT